MLIPAVIAAPVLSKRAMLLVVHAPDAVLGVQLVLVYQAVGVVASVQRITTFGLATSSPVDSKTAEWLAEPLVKKIWPSWRAVNPAAELPIKIRPPVPAVPLYDPDQPLMVKVVVAVQATALLLAKVRE